MSLSCLCASVTLNKRLLTYLLTYLLLRSQGLSVGQMNTVFVGLIVSRLLIVCFACLGLLVPAGQAGRIDAF